MIFKATFNWIDGKKILNTLVFYLLKLSWVFGKFLKIAKGFFNIEIDPRKFGISYLESLSN